MEVGTVSTNVFLRRIHNFALEVPPVIPHQVASGIVNVLRDFGEEIERIEDLEVAGGAGPQFLIPGLGEAAHRIMLGLVDHLPGLCHLDHAGLGEGAADLLAEAGYAAAEDRLLQMELIRRKATGRLPEVFGPDWVDADREARIAGHTAYAPRAFALCASLRLERTFRRLREGLTLCRGPPAGETPCCFHAQASSFNPPTRWNSWVLFVTSVRPLARA
jgi:hypothetical protein